ncbi:hypothetical protein CFP56_006439 [Quercus suber]|uniref:Uncharacterized protein n=1 Tax=Quercus suber TaxID=58331 RepID=A0AAW0L9N1_QUESU
MHKNSPSQLALPLLLFDLSPPCDLALISTASNAIAQQASVNAFIDDIPYLFGRINSPRCPQRKKPMAAKSVLSSTLSLTWSRTCLIQSIIADLLII